MQRTICGKLYDTETATRVDARTVGDFGDPRGYEEILYLTPDGSYFLFGTGGEESPYAEEKITRLSKKKAEEWQKQA